VSRARVERGAGRTERARQLFAAGIEAFQSLDMPFWLERSRAEARSLA
jgi:hypothetical protein